MVTGEEPRGLGRHLPSCVRQGPGTAPPTAGLCITENEEGGGTVWESPQTRVLESQPLSEKQEGNVGRRHPTPLWSLRKVSNAVGGPAVKVGHWQSCASQQ